MSDTAWRLEQAKLNACMRVSVCQSVHISVSGYVCVRVCVCQSEGMDACQGRE